MLTIALIMFIHTDVIVVVALIIVFMNYQLFHCEALLPGSICFVDGRPSQVHRQVLGFGLVSEHTAEASDLHTKPP